MVTIAPQPDQGMERRYTVLVAVAVVGCITVMLAVGRLPSTSHRRLAAHPAATAPQGVPLP